MSVTGPGIEFKMPDKVAAICATSRTTELILGNDFAMQMTSARTTINGSSMMERFVRYVSTQSSDNVNVAPGSSLKFPVTAVSYGTWTVIGGEMVLTNGTYVVSWNFTATTTGVQVVLKVSQGSISHMDGPAPSIVSHTSCGSGGIAPSVSNSCIITVDSLTARISLVNETSANITLSAGSLRPTLTVHKISEDSF